jgi:glycosyltransferase involved in cell wall biosynthesis
MVFSLIGGRVRILVSLKGLSIGGSQINAIEIGGKLAEAGHEVLVYAPDGRLRERIIELGLEHVPAGPARRRHPPTLAGVRAITDLVRQRRIDLVHAYEWSPALEAAYGPHLLLGVPLLATVYAVDVPRFVPRRVPLIVGYPRDADIERRRGRRDVHVVMCPLDVDANAPVANPGPARQRFGLRDDDLAVVIVSRLAPELKREGIVAAIAAAGLVDPSLRLRLLIVGDGPCRAELAAAAAAVNARAGREVVTLAGAMVDPRDAYAAADVVAGMGTSAQKGMAFGKPVVIQGERGFWEIITPQNLDTFLHRGFYGLGDGSDGAPIVARILTSLALDRAQWTELGKWGRETAVARFSNEAAGKLVMDICQAVTDSRPSVHTRVAGLVPTSAWFAGFRLVEFGRGVTSSRP